MKILVASDSFKGTMSSSDIGLIVQEELSPFHEVDWLPVSDGGEGFLDAWREFYPGQSVKCLSCDPLGREIFCDYILTADKTAIIESAVTIGQGLLLEAERNPMKTSSYGLGLMIGDAIRQGARKVYIGLGGSATNDGGTGLLMAIGEEVRGEEVKDVEDVRSGRIVKKVKNGEKAKNVKKGQERDEVLGRILGIDTSVFETWIEGIEFFAVCDVDNPLLGPGGATRVYGPQKGAGAGMVEALETKMALWAEEVVNATGNDFREVPGTGAAGGLGFCLKSYFDARILKGIDAMIEISGLESIINQYDMIITGEGKLDRQTGSGKVPMGILKLGEKNHIPVICICGINESTDDMGFARVFPIIPRHASLAESIADPENALRKLIRADVIPWLKK